MCEGESAVNAEWEAHVYVALVCEECRMDLEREGRGILLGRPLLEADWLAAEPEWLPQVIVSTALAQVETRSNYGVPHVGACIRSCPWSEVGDGLVCSLQALWKARSTMSKSKLHIVGTSCDPRCL